MADSQRPDHRFGVNGRKSGHGGAFVTFRINGERRLVPGHGCHLVVENDQRVFVAVVDGICQTRHAGMEKGAVSDK